MEREAEDSIHHHITLPEAIHQIRSHSFPTPHVLLVSIFKYGIDHDRSGQGEGKKCHMEGITTVISFPYKKKHSLVLNVFPCYLKGTLCSRVNELTLLEGVLQNKSMVNV